MNQQEQLERQERITTGLKVAYQRMLEFKRLKKSVIVIARDGQIIRLTA